MPFISPFLVFYPDNCFLTVRLQDLWHIKHFWLKLRIKVSILFTAAVHKAKTMLVLDLTKCEKWRQIFSFIDRV